MAPKDISVTISAKDQASAAIKETKKQLGELKDVARDLGKELLAAFGGFALAEFFKESVTAAAEAEAAWSRMGVSVSNAGGNFKTFQPEAERVIDLLSSKTKGLFEKDSMAAGLEKLIEVSGNAKGALGALPIVLDLARAKHMDLESAATLVGRVMTGNTSMLKRYGIVVDETKDAVAQLAAKFSGFAENDAKTMLGTIDRLSVAWKEFQQAVGRALTSGDANAGEGLIGVLAQMEAFVTANEGTISDLTDAFVSLAGALQIVLFPLKLVAVGFSGVYLLFALFTAAVLDFKEVIRGFSGFFVENFGDVLNGLSPIFDLIGIKVGKMAEQFKKAGKELQDMAKENIAANRGVAQQQIDRVGAFGDRLLQPVDAPAKAEAKGQGTLPPLPTAAMSKGDNAAVKSLADAIRHLGEETADGKTKAQQFAEKMDELRVKMATTKGVTEQMERDFQRLNEVLGRIQDAEAADAFRQLGEAIQEVTGDAVSRAMAEMSKKLEVLRKNGDKVTDPAKQAAYAAGVAEVNRLYSVQQNTLKLIEESTRISGDAERNGSGPASLVTERGKIAAALTTEELLHGRNTEAAKKLRAEYDRLTASILGMTTAATAGAATLAQGILSAGASLGIFDQNTQKAIGGIIDLAKAWGDLQALHDENKFTLADTASGWVGAIMAVAGIIGTLSGSSPEQAARIKVQVDNTEALYKLRDTLHASTLSLTGNDQKNAFDQLTKWINAPSGFGAMVVPYSDRKTGLLESFQSLGIDPSFLNEVAKKLGVTIDGTADSYVNLAQALEITQGRIAAFTDSFSDLTTEYDAYAKIFNVTDPVELLKLHAKAAMSDPTKGGSSTIAGLFTGVDVSSSAGQATLQKRIQDVFTQMMAGGAGVDMGGLNRTEFLQVLETLSGDITGLSGAVNANTRAIYGVPAGLHVSLEEYRAAAQWTATPPSGGTGTTGTGGTTSGTSGTSGTGGTTSGSNGGTTSGTGTGSGTAITVNLVLDNKVVAKSVLQTYEAASARVNGATTEWSSITSGAL